MHDPTHHQHKGDPAMSYQHLIRSDLDRLGHPSIDPRQVEASMRCVFGTLDHLDGAEWDRAVQEAVAEVRAMGPQISEALAESWGLWRTPTRRTPRCEKEIPMLYETDAGDLIEFAKKWASLGDAVTEQVEDIVNDLTTDEVNPSAIGMAQRTLRGLNQGIDLAMDQYLARWNRPRR